MITVAPLPAVQFGNTSWGTEVAEAYLQLLKKTLVRLPFGPADYQRLHKSRNLSHSVLQPLRMWATARAASPTPGRLLGMEWPTPGETMIGLLRMDNIHWCARQIIREHVPGDLLEAGVWRGGAGILMQGVLFAYAEVKRKVWLADSFEGMPALDLDRYPQDHDSVWTADKLAVPLSTVQDSLRRYGLLDDRVQFLQGWFADTLPSAPIDQLAMLRLDGARYKSTVDTLRWLYPKVSPGGFVIIDDYGAIPGCRRAVDEYRRCHGIVAPLHRIDWTGVFWRVGVTSRVEKSS